MDTQHESPELPLCPDCTEPMVLARTWPRVGGLPELRTFQCSSCNFVFTEVATGEGALAERACVLRDEACHRLQ